MVLYIDWRRVGVRSVTACDQCGVVSGAWTLDTARFIWWPGLFSWLSCNFRGRWLLLASDVTTHTHTHIHTHCKLYAADASLMSTIWRPPDVFPWVTWSNQCYFSFGASWRYRKVLKSRLLLPIWVSVAMFLIFSVTYSVILQNWSTFVWAKIYFCNNNNKWHGNGGCER